MELSVVVKHSILSGLFAALAALFGKLSTTPSISRSVLLALALADDHLEVAPLPFIFLFTINYLISSLIPTSTLVWAAQLLSIGLMIAANGLMWSQYSLALAFSRTSLLVTAINTVSNFIFTALLGRLLFSETISAEWAAGISCILLGIVLLKEQSESVLAEEDKQLSAAAAEDTKTK
ncbi:hypothetical protein TYRP_012776 [Tyrophagus putrescentiae]|nr:hypothetical protein TYRP_012776 [Tyrophagus putrescentiae]